MPGLSETYVYHRFDQFSQDHAHILIAGNTGSDESWLSYGSLKDFLHKS